MNNNNENNDNNDEENRTIIDGKFVFFKLNSLDTIEDLANHLDTIIIGKIILFSFDFLF